MSAAIHLGHGDEVIVLLDNPLGDLIYVYTEAPETLGTIWAFHLATSHMAFWALNSIDIDINMNVNLIVKFIN